MILQANSFTFPDFLDRLLDEASIGNFLDTKDSFHLYKDRSWKRYPRTDLHSTKTQPTQDKLIVILNDGSKTTITTPESGVKYLVDLHDFTMFIQTQTLNPGDIITHAVYSGARGVIEFAASSGYPAGSNVPVTPPLQWDTANPVPASVESGEVYRLYWTGGVSPFQIKMTFPNGGTGDNHQATASPSYVGTSTLDPIGDYTVTVTDAKGATISHKITVTPFVAKPLHFYKDLASAASFNLNDTGHFEVQAAGGVPPYTYRWHLDTDNHFANNDTNSLYIKFGYAQIDTLYATVMDSAGNVATSNTMTITTTDPNQMTWVQNNPGDMLKNGVYDFKWIGGKAPYKVDVYKNAATPDGVETVTNTGEYTFKASNHPLATFYQVIVRDDDGRRLESGFIYIYGVAANQKTLSIYEGAKINAPDWFNTTLWKSIPGYTAGAWSTTGQWSSSDPNDLHITFPTTGTYTVTAGYAREGSTDTTPIPEVSDTVTVTVNVAQPKINGATVGYVKAGVTLKDADSMPFTFIDGALPTDILTVTGTPDKVTWDAVKGELTIAADATGAIALDFTVKTGVTKGTMPARILNVQ